MPNRPTMIPASLRALARKFVHSQGTMMSKMAVVVVLAGWPLMGHAGTIVCWSDRFAGLHEVSDRAEAALGVATHDSSRVRIYFEEVNGVFFYQSNYLPAGERSPAKIASTEPLSVLAVLSNVLARRVPGSRIDGGILETASKNVAIYARVKGAQPELETAHTFTAQAPISAVWGRPVLIRDSY